MIKKLFFGLSALLILFGGLVYEKHFKHKHVKDKAYPVCEEKHFVIVVPSYNNSKYIEKNLHSIFSQNYKNYRVLYIDDCSSDDTLEKAKKLLSTPERKEKTILIHNPVNQGALANIYNAVHTCLDHEIVILVDGDDYLAHEEVLNVLNQAYADPDTWITYGNFLDYPSYSQEPKICRPLSEKVRKKHLLRQSPWTFGHLRTFYAGLFKQIKIEDLFYRGRFYGMAYDVALMLPMVEMASYKIRYIDEVLYLYNRTNPISDHKVNLKFQSTCDHNVRAKAPYKPLEKFPSNMVSLDAKADLLIFSNDRPMQLLALIESVNTFVEGVNQITVLYKSSTPDYRNAYLELKLKHPNIQFVEIKSFKKQLEQITFDPKTSHIVFAEDTTIVKDYISLSKAISTLNETKAFGFYFGYHKNLTLSSDLSRHQPLPPLTSLRGIASSETPFAWQFSSGQDDWSSPGNLNFALYAKKVLRPLFAKLEYDSIDTLREEWTNATPEKQVGLLFASAKSIRLPPPKNHKEFLELFTSGLKIDLAPLFRITATSQEIDLPLSFSTRE